jgi:hypothetical protein
LSILTQAAQVQAQISTTVPQVQTQQEYPDIAELSQYLLQQQQQQQQHQPRFSPAPSTPSQHSHAGSPPPDMGVRDTELNIGGCLICISYDGGREYGGGGLE